MTWPPSVGATTEPADPARRRGVVGRPNWPLWLLLVGYPLLWLAGLAFLALPLLAVPLAWRLAQRRPIRIPAGFGWWLLLLVVLLLSAIMLTEHAPGTAPPTVGLGRYLAFGLRLADYVAAGVILLYVGNTSERELPTATVVRWLSTLFLVVVACGIAGLLLPPVELPTPARFLLPGGLLNNGYVEQLVTVTFAQWHDILGEQAAPRPSAPFLYTNQWGNALSMLLPWFVLGAVLWARSRRRRYAAVAGLALAIVPISYSLNRGLWLGLLVLAGYGLGRLVLRGNLLPAAITLAGVGLVAVVFLLSPLAGVVQDRLDNPHSNDRRGATGLAAVAAARSSPFLGYGGQLSLEGSDRSIAVGPSPDCPRCGHREVGGEGQIFQLLVTTGFVGAACYVAFLARVWWCYRRDGSAVGIAGAATLVLTAFYLPIYRAMGVTLAVLMIGVGLWWRQAAGDGQAGAGARAGAERTPGPAPPLAALGSRDRSIDGRK